ncbi:MAG TPA: hypothetical protein VK708_10290 [Bryobacteraceae bacterium]|nr:hypothetical protein [Bryobacteraceae bacterium]
MRTIGWGTKIIGTIATVTLLALAAPAQWINYPTPGIPRTPDGKPNLAAPAPRTADGKPDLSGIWRGPGTGGYDRNIARDLSPRDIQPWAEALYQQRVRDMGKDAPRANCLPDPFPYYHTVDLARFVQTPGLLVILYQGSTNSIYRTVFTDGRELPKDPNPTWLGYSVGHWEGETLVVDTAGFNNKSWLDVEGHPQTEALHITERFYRRDFGHMDLTMTIDDSGVFTRPFTVKIDKTFAADTDLLETVCENDRSVRHMVGATTVAKLAPQMLTRYAGNYEFAPGRDAVITIENDLLFLREGANPLKLPLVANSETVFVSRTNGDWIEFTRDAQGTATGFVYHAGDHDRTAVRKK